MKSLNEWDAAVWFMQKRLGLTYPITNRKRQTMSFNVKGKFYVNYSPSGKKWDDLDEEDIEAGKLPDGWYTTLDAAKAGARAKAQKDRDGDTYVVFQPIHTVVTVPPDVVTVELN